MVDKDALQLDRVFHALSDATRRAILEQLAHGEQSVTEVAEPHDQTLAGISKHLKVLEAASLIEKTRLGRVIQCRATLEPLGSAYAALEELGAFWRKKLEALDLFLKEEKEHINDKQSTTSKSRRKKIRSR